ncbi:bifunctional nuclease family protein [Cellulomonas endophytica]|uniref:bifunctional nuclease family protein n=1 Tax=Cellulomonas endophytica TaxID=2494735 RepID=UPI0010111A70|nr:bifunctional nuclease family protein [Cellulomonas endophytica]
MAEDLVTVEVVGVRQQEDEPGVLVLLLEPGTDLVVPIVVGETEGAAIVAALTDRVPPRPLTHDLLHAALVAAGSRVERVAVTSLERGVFHAELVLSGGAHVDSRASDAIAVALRFGCPVLCARSVVDRAGVEVRRTAPEDELEEFRAFLDEVSADDFKAEDPPA